MGSSEISARRGGRAQDITKYILAAVAVAGILTIAVVAPNVIGAMGKVGIMPKKRQKEIINRARDRMVNNGMLKRVGGRLQLTKKGKLRLQQLERSRYHIQTPKRWDGKWRVLTFDISEANKALRDKIRHTLQEIGFQLLQQSVWVYPYDCADLVALLKHDLHTGSQLLYMVVEEMEGSYNLKERFDLQ